MDHIDLIPSEEGHARARAGDFLVVEAGEGIVRIPAAPILEIMNPSPPTLLPGAPPEVLGVVNYRGTPAPVVDLSRALEVGAVGPKHRVVVLRWKGRTIALAVEDVLSLTDSAESGAPVLALDTLLGSIFQA